MRNVRVKSKNWMDWESKKRGEYKVDSPRVELNRQDVKIILHQHYVEGHSVDAIAGTFHFAVNIVYGIISGNLYEVWAAEWRKGNGYE